MKYLLTMKKLNYFILFVGFLSLSTVTLWAQSGGTGINTDNPQATLDIKTDSANPQSTDGLLIPRMDAFPATDPGVEQDGMMVFITGNGATAKGFYYWDHNATQWQATGGVVTINGLNDAKTSSSSIFLGIDAGANDDGDDNMNIGIGREVLYGSTDSFKNIAIGYRALYANSTNQNMHSNIALGYRPLYNNSAGRLNIAQGTNTLFLNENGHCNIAMGVHTMYENRGGDNNVAQGFYALHDNTYGNGNIAQGHTSLYHNTEGDGNIAQAYRALYENTEGSYNIAVGEKALENNVIGDYNVAMGTEALQTCTGSNNIGIGYQAEVAVPANSNQVRIGNDKITHAGIQ
ncbi:MAG: hypothetical protein CSA95_00335, partial [Bacteroidetes bacterium]